MKNICIFTQTLTSGGAEKQAFLLAKVLKEKYNVYLLVYYEDQIEETYIKKIKDSNISLTVFEGNSINKSIRIFRFFKNHKIDIIFLYLLLPNLLGGIIGRFAGIRYTIGGIRSAVLEKNKILANKLAQNLINRYTIYNSYKALEFSEKHKFNNNNALVIPNALEILNPPITREKKDCSIILSVGRFHHTKDYLTALSAISNLRSITKDFKYIVIGWGELEYQIRDWIKDLNLESFVTVINNPPNLSDYYKEADIYLQTSVFEGMSNTILEAMSFSLPVVATNVGDNDRLVFQSQNGYLCGVQKFEEITNCLFKLVNNREERIDFGIRGYEIVTENYSIDKFYMNYNSFIEELK
jgi:glycosyltransferase involved in cell wall biosynthesis